MTLARYISVVTLALLPVLGAAVVWGGEHGKAVASAAYGAAVAYVNAVAAYAIVVWARSWSVNAFLGAVVGGTLGRMVAMLAAIVLGVRGLSLDALPLVGVLVPYFVLFLVLEVKALPRQVPAVGR